MRHLIAAISLASLIMFPIHLVADTIVLKSGRKIDATKCWEDGDLVKCKVYGQVIGYHKSDIAEIKMNAAPVTPAARDSGLTSGNPAYLSIRPLILPKQMTYHFTERASSQ